ncbi:MAG TPA: preprotein translocase subunit SecE [Candidatus Paceibacterota bacterium]|nr:preprotein translocase subunit SecE [Candidatus Paceibacterota bacterium]
MSISDYLNDTRAELKHVSWPTRQQTVYFTIIVIAISILAGLYLGLFDFLFTLALKTII